MSHVLSPQLLAELAQGLPSRYESFADLVEATLIYCTNIVRPILRFVITCQIKNTDHLRAYDNTWVHLLYQAHKA